MPGVRCEPQVARVVFGDGEHAAGRQAVRSRDGDELAVAKARQAVGAADPHGVVGVRVNLVVRTAAHAVGRSVTLERTAARQHADA